MPPSALRFGPFVLDLERLCLRGPAGEVELRPKSFEVLRHLAERPRRVVPKEALIEAVWPDVAVTDDSLIRCIGEVRRAIADGRQEILKTVPRRGYMLDLPVAAEGGGAHLLGLGRLGPHVVTDGRRQYREDHDADGGHLGSALDLPRVGLRVQVPGV